MILTSIRDVTRRRTGPVAVAFAVGLVAALNAAAPPAWAKICYMPNGHPYECQDWIPTSAAIPVPPPPGSPDDIFLHSLADHQIGAADGNNGVLINTAKAVCGKLDTGVTGAQAVKAILDASHLRPEQAEAFVAAAVGIYCPQHGNRHDLLGTH